MEPSTQNREARTSNQNSGTRELVERERVPEVPRVAQVPPGSGSGVRDSAGSLWNPARRTEKREHRTRTREPGNPGTGRTREGSRGSRGFQRFRQVLVPAFGIPQVLYGTQHAEPRTENIEPELRNSGPR